MPIHTYVCKKCSKGFEVLVGMTAEKPQIKCPACLSLDVQKIFASFGIASSGKSSSGSCGSCSGGDCSCCSG